MVRPRQYEGGLKLTGKQRVRVEGRVFHKSCLVLQIEESFYYYVWNDWQAPEQPTQYRWRDATLADVTGGLVVCVG